MRHRSTPACIPTCSLAVLLSIGCAATHLSPIPASLATGELKSRDRHRSYDDATYSFEHGLRNDPNGLVTRNDWDIQFGNGGDLFSVTMVVNDRSRIIDLGSLTWEEFTQIDLEAPEPHPVPTKEPGLPVMEGHIYLVRTVDPDTDLTAVLRVETLRKGNRVTFTWRRL